jgi:hypothetical protein
MLTWLSPVVSAKRAHVVVFPVPGVPVINIFGFDRCIYEMFTQKLPLPLSRLQCSRRATVFSRC